MYMTSANQIKSNIIMYATKIIRYPGVIKHYQFINWLCVFILGPVVQN